MPERFPDRRPGDTDNYRIVCDGGPLPDSALTIDEARLQLPSLQAGAYFNTGYCGPLPVSAADAISRELESDLMRPRGRADASEHELELAGDAKAAFASMLDGVSGEDLVLTDSTSHGIGLFVSGLGLREGMRFSRLTRSTSVLAR